MRTLAQRVPPFKVKNKVALIHPAARQQFGQPVEEVHGDAFRWMNAGLGKELAGPAARLRQGQALLACPLVTVRTLTVRTVNYRELP